MSQTCCTDLPRFRENRRKSLLKFVTNRDMKKAARSGRFHSYY